MTDPRLLEAIYKRWLRLAEQCAPREGADADDALSEAVEVALKKPLTEEQAAGVWWTCLKRVRSDRHHRKEETIPADCWSKEPLKEERMSEEVQLAIKSLSSRDQRVIRQRFFNAEKRTPRAVIGCQEGVSGERIRQLELRALRRLRVLLVGRWSNSGLG